MAQILLLPANSVHGFSLAKFSPKLSLPRTGSHSATISAVSLRTRACSSDVPLQRKNQVTVNDDYRPLANFHPCIWRETFNSISADHLEFIESYDKRTEEAKEKVKEMLTAAASSNDPAEEVLLIDYLCRLGVSYHFESEIEHRLNQIFGANPSFVADHGDYDLHTVATIFRVFRQHGFKMPCGIFDKFMEKDNKFKDSLKGDVRGMLSLYEATQLRLHGENNLEEALTFTTTQLKLFLANINDNNSVISPHLEKHITDALELPSHKSVPRLAAYKYICFYEHDVDSRNDTLLKFAKLDFNRIQLLHRQELSSLTRWWKDLNFASIYSYSRDRLAEIYFWSVAKTFESHYSNARLIFTKIIMLLMVIDDTYDAYATLDELQVFTNAIQRWDINAISELPDYMKPLYRTLIDLFDELSNDMEKEDRSYSVSYTKDMMIEVVSCYFKEAEWFREGYVPPFEELLSNAIVTAACCLEPACAWIGMGEIARVDAFEWLRMKPMIVMSIFAACRYIVDVVSHEMEQRRGHVVSVVEAYMIENGTSKEETVKRFKVLIDNSWKDVNEELMRPTIVPLRPFNVVVNALRIAEVFYAKGDGVTHPEYLEDYITKLFINQIPI